MTRKWRIKKLRHGDRWLYIPQSRRWLWWSGYRTPLETRVSFNTEEAARTWIRLMEMQDTTQSEYLVV